MFTKSIAHPKFSSFPKPKLSTIIKSILWVLALCALWFYRASIYDMLTFVSDREGLIEYLGDYGKWGALLLFVILLLQVIVAAIPGHAFMLVGGYLYGFLPGFLLIHASTVIGSQFTYWLAKKYGRPAVEKLAPTDVVEKWTKRAERQGIVFFFFAFNLPIFPSDVMNFVAGLSGISTYKFLFVNFVGRLPMAIVFAMIGAQGFQISPLLGIVAVVFTIVLFAAWRMVGPKFEK